jgi:TonB family protein
MDGPPLLQPIIAEHWVPEPAQALRSRPWQPPVVESSPYDVRNWRFPRVDIWPVTGEGCPTPSEFGPWMGAQPIPEATQTPPKPTPAPAISTPASEKPRMVQWLRPDYPLEWAQTELEGTIQLSLRILSIGDTDDIRIERSSGSQKLDASAAVAAKSWRFAPARWQGRPIESRARMELTFRFFEYSVSRIDDEAPTGASKRDLRSSAHDDRSEVVRRLVEQLRAGTRNAMFTGADAPARPRWPTAMRDWGPLSGIRYLGTIGIPQWRRYPIASKFRMSEHANSVVVRWELYRVVHEDHAALWEIALDRTGGVWALKAESLDAVDRANKSAVVCPGATVR